MHELYAKKLSRKERREKWKELILAYHADNQSQKEFSKVHGLKGRDLSRWIYRLNSSSKKLRSSNKAKEISVKGLANAEICGNFVEVKMGVSENYFSSEIKLTHTSGFSLEVKETTDDKILRKLLTLFREISSC